MFILIYTTDGSPFATNPHTIPAYSFCSTNRTIICANAAMANPITAKTMVFLALVSLLLSPAAVTYLNPPTIIIITATMPTTKLSRVITARMTPFMPTLPGGVSEQSALLPSVSQTVEDGSAANTAGPGITAPAN